MGDFDALIMPQPGGGASHFLKKMGAPVNDPVGNYRGGVAQIKTWFGPGGVRRRCWSFLFAPFEPLRGQFPSSVSSGYKRCASEGWSEEVKVITL
jgi:hypothetical protein